MVSIRMASEAISIVVSYPLDDRVKADIYKATTMDAGGIFWQDAMVNWASFGGVDKDFVLRFATVVDRCYIIAAYLDNQLSGVFEEGFSVDKELIEAFGAIQTAKYKEDASARQDQNT